MECLQIDSTTTFIDERKKEILEENKITRFLRKKYKCILLWLLSIISFSQVLVIILEKIDEKMLNKITHAIFERYNYTNIL